MISIGEEDFSIDGIISKLKRREVGGIVVFLGVVKGFREGEMVSEMLIEAYKEVAEEKLKTIRETALKKFNIVDAAIIHRIGRLKPSDNIVIVAASAGNRVDAFKACSWMIDEVKTQAPIWKKEFTPGGGRWVKEAG